MNQQIENNNKLKNRIVPGIIIAVVFMIIVSIAIIGGKVDSSISKPLRIISYVIFSLVFVWAIFELCQAFLKDLPFSIGLAILSSTIMIFPLSVIEEYVNNSLVDAISPSLPEISRMVFSDYASPIAILVISIIYIIHRFVFVSNVNKKNILIKSAILFTIIYAIQISFKLLIFSTRFDLRYIFLFVGAAVLSDIAGFFSGKYFGRKYIKIKFVPYLSPKKTWEGTIGSYIVTFIFTASIIFAEELYTSNFSSQWLAVILLPILPTAGDLVFSFIKRITNIKDFSRILSGHGGLLDRFDSICAISFLGFLMALTSV